MSLPIDCTTDLCGVSIPVMEFSNCSPQVRAGGITRIYMMNPDELDVFDWADPADWAARVSNTDATVTAIRELTVVGDMPLSEATERTISDNRTSVINRDRTLNFYIDDISFLNYEWSRQMDCGVSGKFWFVGDDGTLLYGGQEGIDASITIDLEIPEDITDIQRLRGTLRWKSKVKPAMIANPIA
jgi:hypothetical protein